MCIKSNPEEKEKIVSLSRFPSEIKENLFLGNLINVIDKGFR